MSDTDKAAPPARAPECVIVCQQSVDCGAWPNGACEQGCTQAERAAKAEPAAPTPAAQAGDAHPETERERKVWAAGWQDGFAAGEARAAAQAGDELPLPEPVGFIDADGECHVPFYSGITVDIYTADQMRAYALAARGAQAGAQAKLAQFGALVLEAHRGICDAGDVDGGTLQEYALAAGVLEPRTVTEPCGDHCVCAFDLPAVCYFTAPDVLAVLKESKG